RGDEIRRHRGGRQPRRARHHACQGAQGLGAFEPRLAGQPWLGAAFRVLCWAPSALPRVITPPHKAHALADRSATERTGPGPRPPKPPGQAPLALSSAMATPDLKAARGMYYMEQCGR